MIPNAKLNFALEKLKLHFIQKILDIPEKNVCQQDTTAPGIEGLCLLLRQLAYPCLYSDLIHSFGEPIPELSMIYHITLDFIYNTHSHRIT